MNKQRRTELAAVMDQITAFAKALDDAGLLGQLNSILEDGLQPLRDEEEEYYENMPEGVQSGEKGENAREAVNALDEALDALTTLRDAIDEFNTEDVLSKIDDARGA